MIKPAPGHLQPSISYNTVSQQRDRRRAQGASQRNTPLPVFPETWRPKKCASQDHPDGGHEVPISDPLDVYNSVGALIIPIFWKKKLWYKKVASPLKAPVCLTSCLDLPGVNMFTRRAGCQRAGALSPGLSLIRLPLLWAQGPGGLWFKDSDHKGTSGLVCWLSCRSHAYCPREKWKTETNVVTQPDNAAYLKMLMCACVSHNITCIIRD